MATAWNSSDGSAARLLRPVWAQSLSIARTIPGLRAAWPALAKKPAQSVSVDGRSWQAAGAPRRRTRTPHAALREIAAIATPTPAGAADRDHLVKSILADFVVVFLSVAAVHIPACCKGLSWSDLRFAVPLIWTHLCSSDLGLALTYAALITLLAYSERVPALPEDHLARLRALGKAVAWATVLVLAAIKLSGAGTMSPQMLVAAAILNSIGMLGWRTWMSRCRSGKASGTHLRNVLIVGADRLGYQLAEWLGNFEPSRVVKGFIDQNRGADPRILGTIESLPEIARSEFADEVIVALPQDREMARAAVVAALRNHLDVRLVPDLLGYGPEFSRIESIGPLPVITLHEESVPQSRLVLKRLIDMLGASLALLLLTPCLLVISLLIKIDSPGPILYPGERVGRKGRRFLCRKFRTMTSNADELKDNLRSRNERVGPIFKMKDDPRVTRIGRILRRYSLDELPQLWNVLKGDMSLVGPRPHPVDDFVRYRLEHLRRLDMTPGLTGLWQVTARRDPSFETSMALDVEYIEKWSLRLDLQILLKTIPAVLAGTGA